MANQRPTWWGISSSPPLRLLSQGKGDEPDEPALVRGLVAHQEWAARVAWNRYAPMVYGLLDRALGAAGESEDLTQEVFLRVFAAIRTLRDPAALRSFVYSTAIRMLRWHLRSKRIRRLLTLSDSGTLPERPAPAEDSDGREILTRFYRCLDSLSANDRTAFVLRRIEGMSMQQIVEVTGASLATAKRRIRRATQQLASLAAADPDLSRYLVDQGDCDDS